MSRKTPTSVFVLVLVLAFVFVFVPVGHAQSVKTIRADFVQQKTMKMMTRKLVSRGRMFYQAPDRLQWEYTSPKPFALIIDGDKMLLRKGNKKNAINMSQNKKFKEICDIMMSSVVLSGNEPVKEMPLTKEMKSLYQKIVIYFNTKTHLADRVVMYEKKGDITEITFSNMVSK